jgi:hypothetical protein
MRSMQATLVMTLSAASAWRVPPPPVSQVAQTRRGLMQAAASVSVLSLLQAPAHAMPSDLALSGMSKDDLYAAAKARSEGEKLAVMPINLLKASRDQFSTAAALIDASSWTELRDLIQATTGPKLSELLKDGKFFNPATQKLAIKIRKDLFSVDTFAYSQQSFLGIDSFSGYWLPDLDPNPGLSMLTLLSSLLLSSPLKRAMFEFL